MTKKEKIKISIAIGISITLLCSFFSISYLKTKEISPPSTQIESNTKKDYITLDINGFKYKSEIVGIKKVYEIMEKLKEDKKITFEEKTYSGMGKFIEEINGIKNNGEKNWIYYVNNKKANIGISNYEVKAGDIISWKYEKNIN
jgi:hypothetical protein